VNVRNHISSLILKPLR